MRRRLSLSISALAAACAVAAVTGAAGAHGHSQNGLHGRGLAYFAVGCAFSHANNDDAIVFPNQPGRSHHHTYFGNRSTNASSTPESLRAAGRTSCRLRSDTAAYWVPTLFERGNDVQPLAAAVYYVRRTVDPVQAFPPGLKMIAGNSAARSPQSQDVTFWRCGFRRSARSSSVPACTDARVLQLQVNFPNCWDGSNLDSADHKSHMAYSVDGRCPASHPVETPAISIVVYYRVVDPAVAELASGSQFSGHGDFINAWNQQRLVALVDRYLNRTGRRR